MLVMTTATGKALHVVNRDGKNSPCNVADTMRRADQWSRQPSRVYVQFAEAVTCKRCLKALAAEVLAAENAAHAANDMLTAARSTGQPVLPVGHAAEGGALLMVSMGLLVETPDGFMDPVAQERQALARQKADAEALERQDATARAFPYPASECPGFDPGNVLAAYDGRQCVNCGVREPNGYTAHGLVERDPETTVHDLPEASAAIILLTQGLPLADTVTLLQNATAYGNGRAFHAGRHYRAEVGAARGTFRVWPRPKEVTEPARVVERSDKYGQRPDGTTANALPELGAKVTTETARTMLVRGGLPEDRAVALMVSAGEDPDRTMKAETVFRARRFMITRLWVLDRWQVAIV